MIVSPGDSSRPANRLPIMHALAPLAMALVMSPLWRMPPSAITGTPAFSATLTAFMIAEICGTPTPLTIPRRADRPGADADLHRVDAGVDQVPRPSTVATLPAITWMSRSFLIRLTVSITLRTVAVGGVDGDDVDLGLDEGLDAGEVVHARGRADAQATAGVFAGVGVLVQLVDVAHRDHARQPPLASMSSSFSTFCL
jgi:hypothetical protein